MRDSLVIQVPPLSLPVFPTAPGLGQLTLQRKAWWGEQSQDLWFQEHGQADHMSSQGDAQHSAALGIRPEPSSALSSAWSSNHLA